MKITTILIDDEHLALEELKIMLQLHPGIEIVATASNALDAVKKIIEYQPKLIFLDINMPGKSGFDMLEDLKELPFVIFVTAYDQYAIKAFEVNAMDYILKPVNKERLAESIDKVKKQIELVKPGESKLGIDKRILSKTESFAFLYLWPKFS